MKFRIVIGVLLILIGFAVIGDKISDSNIWSLISTYWPVILIFWGLDSFFSKKNSVYFSLFISILGALFLLGNLGLTPLEWYDFIWPTILIAIGIRFIIPGKWKSKRKKGHIVIDEEIIVDKEFIKNGININQSNDEDKLENYNLFSGFETKVSSQNFKGGEVGSIFGGADIDLTEAKLHDNKARLELYAIFGGVDIIVPKNWKIIVKGTPVFGGITNSTHNTEQNEGEEIKLFIEAYAIFGGIEIKNGN